MGMTIEVMLEFSAVACHSDSSDLV